MVTWLPRSLLFIVAGAVLAYAVTARVHDIDLQTTGIILLLVGVFDLLLNVGLTLYLRHGEPPQPGRGYIPDRRTPAPGEDERYATRPLPRDPGWH